MTPDTARSTRAPDTAPTPCACGCQQHAIECDREQQPRRAQAARDAAEEQTP